MVQFIITLYTRILGTQSLSWLALGWEWRGVAVLSFITEDKIFSKFGFLEILDLKKIQIKGVI